LVLDCKPDREFSLLMELQAGTGTDGGNMLELGVLQHLRRAATHPAEAQKDLKLSLRRRARYF
jgi:hypothetical protein